MQLLHLVSVSGKGKDLYCQSTLYKITGRSETPQLPTPPHNGPAWPKCFLFCGRKSEDVVETPAGTSANHCVTVMPCQ